MNRLYRMRFIIPAACAAAALLFLNCSLEPLSGGGTEGGNTVSGLFINDDGSASAKVRVLLIPSDYDPGAVHQNNPVVASATAGDGSYSFDHVPKGSYSIEATDTASGKRSLITEVDVSGKDFRATVDTLRVPGAIMVFFPASADVVTGYVYVPGTTRYVRLAGAIGYVVMTSLPAKPLPAICYATISDPAPVVLRYNVHVASGDTTVVASTGWKYARRLCLNTTATGAGVTRNVAGFPVIVRLTKDNFDFTRANAAGSDIRFARSDTVRLPYEIERWDAANQRAEIWVRVDTIYGNNDSQTVTMYWGNDSELDISNSTEVFDTGNGFVGVWHMNENPAAGANSIKDRTAHNYNATPYGTMDAAHVVDGAIGKALDFNGSNAYLNAGRVPLAGPYSVGLWVRLNKINDYERIIFEDAAFTLWYDSDRSGARMEHMDNSRTWRGVPQDGGAVQPMVTGTWYYLTGTYDGDKVRLYVNGNLATATNSIAADPVSRGYDLFFGKSDGTSYVDGIMDEIRIEGTARSADWIKLSYMNQRADDKLVIFK